MEKTQRKPNSISKPHITYIEGHRGMNRQAVQNTIKSFQKAIENGIDSIELDVWLTKDKIPVVIHAGDEGSLKEFANSEKMVNDTLYEELDKNIRTKEGNEKIPTLEEVLVLAKNKIFINIEIKDTQIKETFDKVASLLEKHQMFDQICFSSFRHQYYEVINKYACDKNIQIEFGFLTDLKEKKYRRELPFCHYGCSVNINEQSITPEIVKKAHDNHMGVMAWFGMKIKEDDAEYEKLLKLGVDCICCNEPDKAKAFRDKFYNLK